MELARKVREDAGGISARIVEHLQFCRALRSTETAEEIDKAIRVSPAELLARKCDTISLGLKSDIRSLYEELERKGETKGKAGEVLLRTKKLEDALREISVRRREPDGEPSETQLSTTFFSFLELRRNLSEAILTTCLEEKRIFDATYGISSESAVPTIMMGPESHKNEESHTTKETRLAIQIMREFAVLQRILGALLAQQRKRSDYYQEKVVEKTDFLSSFVGVSPRSPSRPSRASRASSRVSERGVEEEVEEEMSSATGGKSRSAMLKQSTLESRQRSKAEERQVAMRLVTTQCEDLQKENQAVLTENSRLNDQIAALELSVLEARTAARKQFELLAPRVSDAEASADELRARVEQNTLNADLMGGILRKRSEECAALTLEIKNLKNNDATVERELGVVQRDLEDMTRLAQRRGRNSTVAMAARNAEIKAHDASKRELREALETIADGIETTVAQKAVIDALTSDLGRREQVNSELVESREKSGRRLTNVQSELSEQKTENENMNRRFNAMYIGGMTPEKQRMYAAIVVQLETARTAASAAEQKNFDLEARIFELELGIKGGAGDDDDTNTEASQASIREHEMELEQLGEDDAELDVSVHSVSAAAAADEEDVEQLTAMMAGEDASEPLDPEEEPLEEGDDT